MSGCDGDDDHHSVKPLSAAFAITAVFFVVELLGGLWTKSLALIADSIHMGVDTVAMGISLFAAYVARRPPDKKRTFGYQRVEVLAALGNGVWLLIATGVILHEAWDRFLHPQPVMSGPMLKIAAVGLLCNLVSGAILFRASQSNINLRAAFLHVCSDAFGSIGAIIAALVILRTGRTEADPVASVLICVGIVMTSLWLVRDAVHILLEGAPAHLDLEEIRASLAGLPGVSEVHDLHLWSLTKGSESLSGHLVITAGSDQAQVLKSGRELLQARYGLSHVTLQIES
jgi:cobalt-zinc-cadmium efflux system protein